MACIWGGGSSNIVQGEQVCCAATVVDVSFSIFIHGRWNLVVRVADSTNDIFKVKCYHLRSWSPLCLESVTIPYIYIFAWINLSIYEIKGPIACRFCDGIWKARVSRFALSELNFKGSLQSLEKSENFILALTSFREVVNQRKLNAVTKKLYFPPAKTVRDWKWISIKSKSLYPLPTAWTFLSGIFSVFSCCDIALLLATI